MSSKNSEKKIKNVIVINDFDYVQGGASKVAIDTANLLADNYNNIKVFYFSAVHDDSSTLNGKVISICTNQKEALKDKTKVRGAINGIYNFRAKHELKKLLKKLNKEETIIHVHGWTKILSSSVFDIIFKMNYKVLLTMHDYFTACPNGGYFNYKKNEICHLKPQTWKCIKCNCDSRNYGFKIYRLFRQFVQNNIVKLNNKIVNVISISDFSEKILKETLNKNAKIYKVNNPVDLPKTFNKVDYKDNEYYIYVGRISKEKGVDIFCDAITKTNKKGIVVGDGNERKLLEKNYPNIEFVGWKNKNEVYEYFFKSKALVFPSRWYEGAPLTILEALSIGLPCIVKSTSAAVDFVKNGENGFIFHNQEELINIINSFNFNKEIIFDYDNNYLKNIVDVYNRVE